MLVAYRARTGGQYSTAEHKVTLSSDTVDKSSDS